MRITRCKICGKPLTRGQFCFDCMRKEQQQRQQRQFFGKPAEHPLVMSTRERNILADLVDKYSLAVVLRTLGNLSSDMEGRK